MHGGQEEERSTLRRRRPLEDGEHLRFIGYPPTDGGIRGSSVVFHDGSEGAEMVSEGLFDQHGPVLSDSCPGAPAGQAWTVTRVPRGVSGNTTWALAIGISTHPSLWGEP